VNVFDRGLPVDRQQSPWCRLRRGLRPAAKGRRAGWWSFVALGENNDLAVVEPDGSLDWRLTMAWHDAAGEQEADRNRAPAVPRMMRALSSSTMFTAMLSTAMASKRVSALANGVDGRGPCGLPSMSGLSSAVTIDRVRQVSSRWA